MRWEDNFCKFLFTFRYLNGKLIQIGLGCPSIPPPSSPPPPWHLLRRLTLDCLVLSSWKEKSCSGVSRGVWCFFIMFGSFVRVGALFNALRKILASGKTSITCRRVQNSCVGGDIMVRRNTFWLESHLRKCNS